MDALSLSLQPVSNKTVAPRRRVLTFPALPVGNIGWGAFMISSSPPNGYGDFGHRVQPTMLGALDIGVSSCEVGVSQHTPVDMHKNPSAVAFRPVPPVPISASSGGGTGKPDSPGMPLPRTSLLASVPASQAFA